MFTVGVYTSQDDKLGEAFAAGARKQGWIVRTRSANDFRERDCEDFNLAFVYTMRTRASDLILREYRRRTPRVPVVVIDYGYLRRACQEQFGGGEGYWQMSLNTPSGLNSIPRFACPSDRFETLDLSINKKGGDPDGAVLVCGQHVGDPSHGRSTARELQAWADEQIGLLIEQGHQKVIFRPHPFSPDVRPSRSDCKVMDPAKYPLDKVFPKIKMVVCQNSNIGHDALLAGVPVIATRSDAPYYELAGPKLPSVEERKAYFSRVAYAQWTLVELERGLWHRWYLDNVSTISEAENADSTGPTAGVPPITGSRGDAFSLGVRSTNG